MPTIKHPCPHCGTFINRDVAACPACGRPDPFAPARCPNCRATIDDPSWVACPACGKPVGAAVAAAARSAEGGRSEAQPGRERSGQTSVDPTTVPSAAAPPAPRFCSGCGAPLPSGARFCRECGTVAG